MTVDPLDLDRQIGAALRQARLSRACTQAELAERLSVGRSALAHYEAGKRPLSVTILLQAAQALQYPPAQLLPSLPDVAPLSAHPPTLPEPVGQIAQILAEHPQLIPSVLDLLETLLDHEQGIDTTLVVSEDNG